MDPYGSAANDPTGYGTTVAAILADILDAREHLVPGAWIEMLLIRADVRRLLVASATPVDREAGDEGELRRLGEVSIARTLRAPAGAQLQPTAS